MKLRFRVLPEHYAVERLPPDSAIPSRATSGNFFSITRTRDELSIVREEANGGWRCLALQGPFALTETGIAAEFTAILARAEIGVLVISTYDTDYVLVAAEKIEAAVRALAGAGHSVTH